ncbi:MAG: hypothetical protein HFE45_03635 [Oscillospiraceae bacterium]|jgi:hypothetical protein|nr:hypothetical protein [Oscillospiraceae bacterium]
MKKKSLIMILASMIVLVSIISVCLLAKPQVLGSMNRSYPEPATTTSDISFSGKAGAKIRFSFKSNVVSGDLNMVLYDSAGNQVYILDKAKESETFFTLKNSDIYILSAECSEFIGNYKIFVTLVSN